MQTTTTPTTEEALLKRAKRRVDMKVGFAVHALVFMAVNLGLYVLSQMHDGHHGGFFPIWGWGLGLLIHGVVTLVALSSDGLRDRLLDAEVQRLRQRG